MVRMNRLTSRSRCLVPADAGRRLSQPRVACLSYSRRSQPKLATGERRLVSRAEIEPADAPIQLFGPRITLSRQVAADLTARIGTQIGVDRE